MSSSGEDSEVERLREQEQARASQLLSTPRERLGRILTPRDLVSAGLDSNAPRLTVVDALDYGDDQIQRTPSGRRVLFVKKRLRNLRALPQGDPGKTHPTAKRQPSVYYSAINAAQRMSTFAPVSASDDRSSVDSINKSLQDKVNKLQRSLELSRCSYDIAVATLLKAVEHDESVIEERTRQIHRLIEDTVSLEAQIVQRDTRLRSQEAELQKTLEETKIVRELEEYQKCLKQSAHKKLQVAVEKIAKMGNVIKCLEADQARANDDAIKMEHRLSVIKRRGRGLEQQLRDAENLVGELRVQVYQDKLEAERDRLALEELLQKAASLDWARDASSPAGKYEIEPKCLTFGLAQEATLGLAHFMCVSEANLYSTLARGIDGVREEIQRHGSEADNECLHYVLFEVNECV